MGSIRKKAWWPNIRKGFHDIKDRSSELKVSLKITALLIAVLMVSGCIRWHTPQPFLRLNNRDDLDHQVHLQIYGSDNESVINKTYYMEAKSGTSYEDRHPADEYRVNVTLGIDVTIEETVNIPDEYATIRVWITDNQSVRIFTETV